MTPPDIMRIATEINPQAASLLMLMDKLEEAMGINPPKHKIQTRHIFPPIPIRNFDWSATFGNYEPGQPIGHGATEQEAIEDLKAQVEK